MWAGPSEEVESPDEAGLRLRSGYGALRGPADKVWAPSGGDAAAKRL